MITLKEFYTIAKRCGYDVFTDDNTFYILYYKNDLKLSRRMARYFDASYSPKETILYRPVSYNYFSPDTAGSKAYSDPKQFEKDLLKNTFTLKKYFFKYDERMHTRTI